MHSQQHPHTETSVAAAPVDETGRIVAAKAPASGVSVPRHLGVGHDLVHALDYVVLLQVMFNLASGLDSDPRSVWKQLQDRGIRSAKDAKRLVGRDAVYDAFARLIASGYLRRVQLPHPKLPGRMGPVVYEFFDNPAWNPDWSPASASENHETVKPQVATLPGTPDPLFPEAGKTAGRNASRNAGSVVPGSGVPGSVKRRVPAGQNASGVPGSGIGSPPHPPEEVTTSSPYPLTNPAGPTGLPSPREEGEGAVCSEDDLRVAADVLELLPAPWTQGRLNAGKLAPKLLTVMAAQGWPEIGVVDRGLLIRQLTKNPHKVSNPYRLLAGDRIPNLPRYAVVAAEAEAARPPGATTDGMCPKHPTYRAGNRCIPCITA
ncbi:hypothetical protein OHB41_51880 [Streptomyces sp. NBC_01571]|uniref:hypothetical protein n=1 Tax=Streptomyces sp. NBC_01571 TaxID=2975883 RepID=UPI0022526B9D|nr:hypothetical protein [Streptomyces sp. NBC_01571]MCX4581461.1 hypothetical protein [Streptomyces sp. NBC_01571]